MDYSGLKIPFESEVHVSAPHCQIRSTELRPTLARLSNGVTLLSTQEATPTAKIHRSYRRPYIVCRIVHQKKLSQ